MATPIASRLLFPDPQETLAPVRQRTLDTKQNVLDLTKRLRSLDITTLSTREEALLLMSVRVRHRTYAEADSRLANELFRAAMAAGLDTNRI